MGSLCPAPGPAPAGSGLALPPPGCAPLTLPCAFPPAGVSTPDIMPAPAAALPVRILPAPASIFTLATVPPPARPTAPSASRPSPVSPSLRPAILQGDYVDLADLLLLSQVFAPRTIVGSCGPVLLRHPEPARRRELTAAEFSYVFSLFRDVVYSPFPGHRAELDDYLSLILQLAPRFGGSGFYTYQVRFSSKAAEWLQQFNEATYWGSLDNEIYCGVLAARSALPCSLCGTPSHPSLVCTVAARSAPEAGPPAPPHPITPQPLLSGTDLRAPTAGAAPSCCRRGG